MFARKSSLRSTAAVLFCAGTLMTGVPAVSVAQSNPGFSFIWGGDGPSRKQQLSYHLEYGTPGHRNDRYKLKIRPQKVAVDSITITFPDYYDGKFRAKNIELRRSKKSRKLFNFKKAKNIPLSSVEVNKESNIVKIIPETPIPAGTRFVAVLSGVKNPKSGGTYFVNCSITSPGDLPLSRYVGTWVMSIFRN